MRERNFLEDSILYYYNYIFTFATTVPPITVLPLLPASSPIRLPIVPSPTTPQATPVGVIQKLRSFYPAVTTGVPTPLTLAPQAEVVDNHRGAKERDGSSSQPQTPRTPVSLSKLNCGDIKFLLNYYFQCAV